MSESDRPKTHASVAGLKARGWTDALIRTFLGEPDTTAPNPHYKSGPPMRLYALARVDAAEASEAFAAAKGAAGKRSATARATADRKRDALVAEAEAMPITVDVMPLATLRARAVVSYNDRGPRRDDDWLWEPARMDSDAAFLERIMVNHARHELSRYDDALEAQFARVGVHEAVRVIRRRVYAAIAQTWPDLAAECTRQLAARGG